MRKTLGLAAFAAVLACGAASAQQVNVKIGVLSDMSSLYADIGGPGSVAAAKMAIADFTKDNPNVKVEMIIGDHQNKPDIGSQIANQWYDVDKVDMRFPLSIVRAVRAIVPKTIPLGARITGSDWREGGLAPDDAVAIAKALKGEGVDFVCISSGGVAADIRNPTEPGYNVSIAARVKKEAGIPTRTVGLIVKADHAEDIVAKGQADLVSMARCFLDDPHWGWHAARDLCRQTCSSRNSTDRKTAEADPRSGPSDLSASRDTRCFPQPLDCHAWQPPTNSADS